MYFLAYLVGGFHSHLHLSSFNINIIIHMKRECKTVPSLCKKGEGIYFCKLNVQAMLPGGFLFYPFKQKVVVFLTFVTIYLIWNPKPDKDNTCTTIHYHEGDTPLRNVCRPISALRTVYRHVLASRTAYRLKTKQPFWEFLLHKKDKMTVCCAHMFNHSCKRLIWCLLVRFPSFRYPPNECVC